MEDYLPEYDNTNEITPELAGIHSLNSFFNGNAPARGNMFASHFSQRPVILGSEPPIICTGVEEEMGKYTFSASMPEDGRVLKIIQRYKKTVGEDAIDSSFSDALVIYRSTETGRIGHFVLPHYKTVGTSFGFRYEPKEALNRLAVDAEFQEGEVFLDSPAVKGKSHYTYGRNLNMAVMSHPLTALDGYVISRDVLPHFATRIYETRTADFGANDIPINLYGDDDNYAIIPEIGQYIKPNGLVMAFRKDIPTFSPALLSKKDLQQVNHFFDKCIYAQAGEGRVVDIEVMHTSNVNRQLPPEMTKPLWKYVRANAEYHRQIVQFETDYLREARRYDKNAKMLTTPAFQRLLVESKAYIDHPVHDTNARGKSLTLIHRKERLDSWRVTVTIEYLLIPNRGFKLTCMNGGVQINPQ